MGELHLEIIVDRMMREFSVQANVGRPQVAYRETIRKKAFGEGKYIRQTGGRGQYGHCKIELHPLPSSSHEDMKEMSVDELDALAKRSSAAGGKWKFDKEHRFLFIDKVVGGSIPREFIAPIEAGIRRGARQRRAGWLPDGGHCRGAGGRQLSRSGQLRNGVQDCRLDGLQGSLPPGEARAA